MVFIGRCAPNANGTAGCSPSPLPPQRGDEQLRGREDAQRDGAQRAGGLLQLWGWPARAACHDAGVMGGISKAHAKPSPVG